MGHTCQWPYEHAVPGPAGWEGGAGSRRRASPRKGPARPPGPRRTGDRVAGQAAGRAHRGCQQQAEEPGQEAVAVGPEQRPQAGTSACTSPTCVAEMVGHQERLMPRLPQRAREGGRAGSGQRWWGQAAQWATGPAALEQCRLVSKTGPRRTPRGEPKHHLSTVRAETAT